MKLFDLLEFDEGAKSSPSQPPPPIFFFSPRKWPNSGTNKQTASGRKMPSSPPAQYSSLLDHASPGLRVTKKEGYLGVELLGELLELDKVARDVLPDRRVRAPPRLCQLRVSG